MTTCEGDKIPSVALVALSPAAKAAFVRAIRSGKTFDEATAIALQVFQKRLERMEKNNG